jgi:hypothetical protein
MGSAINGKKPLPLICFLNLQSRAQSRLRNWAPSNSAELDDETIERYRIEFLEGFSALADRIPDAKTMRRLMISAVNVRNARKAANQPKPKIGYRRELMPVSTYS